MAESLSNDWLKQRLDSNHRESPYSIPDKRCWIIALSGLVKPMHILGAYSIISTNFIGLQILDDSSSAGAPCSYARSPADKINRFS